MALVLPPFAIHLRMIGLAFFAPAAAFAVSMVPVRQVRQVVTSLGAMTILAQEPDLLKFYSLGLPPAGENAGDRRPAGDLARPDVVELQRHLLLGAVAPGALAAQIFNGAQPPRGHPLTALLAALFSGATSHETIVPFKWT
jgi:hypothetical protein